MLLNGVTETQTEDGQIIQIGDLQIVNTKFDEVFGKEISRWLNGYEKYEKFTFDTERSINIFGDDFFIIEYNNKEVRNDDILQYNQHFEKNGEYKAKKLENGRQVPENSGYFDYNGKYYLILYSYNRLIDEISDYVYKGVVINPGKYFEVNNQANETNSKVKEVLN